MDNNINSKSVEIMKKGLEATKKIDDESRKFDGKIPQYVMDSTDLILYTSVMTLPPTVMAKISKMLIAHCDHLYMVGFLHGKENGIEQGREAGINYMMGVINPLFKTNMGRVPIWFGQKM